MCRKTKYILQKPTPKIKQLAIQLTISQLFQKPKNRNTNKHGLSRIKAGQQTTKAPPTGENSRRTRAPPSPTAAQAEHRHHNATGPHHSANGVDQNKQKRKAPPQHHTIATTAPPTPTAEQAQHHHNETGTQHCTTSTATTTQHRHHRNADTERTQHRQYREHHRRHNATNTEHDNRRPPHHTHHVLASH
jgi:hypothetical protein